MFFFFFSSRRRHTRLQGDWSSDVCSSDLGLHGTLMHREMCDPSEALPVIVDEFIGPMVGEMREIAAHLEPRLDRGAVERCVFSITGQALYYRFTMPATLRMLGVPAYPRGFAARLARHITEFSLGGMEWVAGGRRHAR